MADLNQCFKRNEDFVFRQIENETILVPIKDNVADMNCIYNLNEVGAFIWRHLDGSKSLFDVKNLILEEFNVTDRQAETDLTEFSAELESIAGILRVDTQSGR